MAEELSRVPYLSPVEFDALLKSGGNYTIIDTRKVYTYVCSNTIMDLPVILHYTYSCVGYIAKVYIFSPS